MPQSQLRFIALCAAGLSALSLAACDAPGTPIVHADTFPMGTADRFDQSPPKQPIFGKTDYMRSRDVLPVALADIREPLPPAVPLPPPVRNIDVIEPTAENAQPSQDQGGSSPASGMAQGITNAQGGGETNQHDGGKTNVPRE